MRVKNMWTNFLKSIVALACLGVTGLYLVPILFAFVATINTYVPPNPLRVGACAANQYSFMCTGMIFKVDREVPFEAKIQDRVPQ